MGDIARFFPTKEDADAVFALFDKDGNGDASREEMEMACLCVAPGHGHLLDRVPNSVFPCVFAGSSTASSYRSKIPCETSIAPWAGWTTY